MMQILYRLVLAVLGCVTAHPHSADVQNTDVADGKACSAEGLHSAAHVYGKYFGTATAVGEFSNQAYARILDNWKNFGQLTPAVGMKWKDIEPAEGQFNWPDGDAIMQRALTNGQLLRCHALVWHQDLPFWITGQQWTRKGLINVLWRHITNVVGHYKGRCFAWDVVNEALNEDGSLRRSIFLDVIGPAYIAIAFQAAAIADPSVKLYYNDYNIDNEYIESPQAPSGTRRRGNVQQRDLDSNQPCGKSVNSKIMGTKCLVNTIRNNGGKIDGIGLQGHYVYNATPSAETLTRLLNDFTAMNLDVAITELDVRMEFNNINAATATMQAHGYANVITACKNTARCVGVTLWEFTDKYSWVTTVFPSMGSAHPWDSELVLKQEIYDSMMQAWGDRICRAH